MATFDFTGNNGDPLPSGLTARNGTFEIQSNRVAATGDVPSGPRWVFTADSQADGSTSCVINLGGSTGGASGVVFRYSDNDNFLMSVVNPANSSLVLFERVAGTFTNVAAFVIPSFSNTTDYTILASYSGTSITVSLDGVQRITHTSSFNQNATQSGMRIGDTLVRGDTLTVTSPVQPDSISISEAPKNNHVYQRSASNNRQVSFDVTYTGSPTALQYRLLDASDDSTEIITWSTFDASPSGGSSTLTFTASASVTGYHVEVRFSNDVGTTDIQSLDWYVGANILIFGQSLAFRLNNDYAVTPVNSYFVYDGTSSTPPTTGAGANRIAQIIQGSEGVAVCIANSGVGGSALTVNAGDVNYWNDPTGSLWTDTVTLVNGMTSGDNELEFAWWHQGTRDSLANVTESQYLSALQSFIPRVRAAFSGKRGTLEVLTAIIARDTRGTATDASHQAIRDAQLTYAASDSNTHPVSVYPVELIDGVHATESGSLYIAEQIVVNYYDSEGLISASIPSVSGIATGDSANELDVVFDSNLLLADSSYSIEGVRVTDGGSDLTVSSFVRKNSTTATITLSSIPESNVLVWLGYGKGLSSSQLAYPRGENVTLPNSGGTFNAQAVSFSEQAASTVLFIRDAQQNINVSTLNETVSLVGSVSVSDSAISVNVSSNNESISVSGDVVVEDALIRVNLASQNETISTTSLIEVLDSSASIEFRGEDESIFLSVAVTVDDTLSTVNISSQDETITLTGRVNIDDSTASNEIQSVNENVVVGGGVTVAPKYTIAFKRDGYTISYAK